MLLLLADLSSSCNADSPLLLVLLGSLGSIVLNVVLPRIFSGVSFLSLLVTVLVWSLTSLQALSFSIADYVYWSTHPSLADVIECTMQRELLEQNIARLAFHTYNSAKLYHFVFHVNRVFKGPDWQRKAVFAVSILISVVCTPATMTRYAAQGFVSFSLGWAYPWALLMIWIGFYQVLLRTIPLRPRSEGSMSDEETEEWKRQLNVAIRDSALARVIAPAVAIVFDKQRSDDQSEDTLLLHRPEVVVREGLERSFVIVFTVLMTWVGLAGFYYRYGHGELGYAEALKMRADEHQSTAEFFTARLDFIQQLRRIMV